MMMTTTTTTKSSIDVLYERLNHVRSTLYKDIPNADHYYPICHSPSRDRVVMQLKGMPEPQEFINFTSGSYFNLGKRPQVREAFIDAFDRYGCGSGGSPTLSGYYKAHEDLEAALSAFHGFPASVLFSSGFGANMAAHATLLGPKDLLLIDESSHGSAFDGATLSRTNVRSFAHNDPDSLRKILQRFRHQAELVVVSTCGVFTMGSEIAPLPELVKCAKEYDALFLLDDAHATGVLGKTGRGSLEHFGMNSLDVDILVGVLGKSLGGIGGYVAATAAVSQLFRFTSRAHMLSTSMAPTTAAGALAALRILDEEGEMLSTSLREKARQFREMFMARGLKPRGQVTGVVSLSVADHKELWSVMGGLLANGIFCNPVVYPAVRNNEARLRFHLNIDHRSEDLLKAAETTHVALQHAQLSAA